MGSQDLPIESLFQTFSSNLQLLYYYIGGSWPVSDPSKSIPVILDSHYSDLISQKFIASISKFIGADLLPTEYHLF